MDRILFGAPELRTLEAALATDEDGLSSRGLGRPITDRRTSWVRSVEIGSNIYYIKTYDYPTWRARLRGTLRNTGPARPSRAAREAAAARWLRAHGFEAPLPVAVLERRRLGFLSRAVLVTRAWPGEPVDRILRGLGEEARRSLCEELFAFVARLHRAGFRDRNLDLRNLLARPIEGGWQFAKLDSPRFRLRRPGNARDSLARADWTRLREQLQASGVLAISP
ncbi:MAG: hypothetical protein Fur0037_15800 [Planctomycetota bacterium]